MRSAVHSHDAGALRRAARRARLLRAVLVAAGVSLLAAAAVSARGLDVRERSILPSGSTGVVVLDLSLSILDVDYGRLRAALRHLIEADAPVGLVVFSDAPYELLPPGTPARELRPVIRLLEPRGGKTPANPWAEQFRAGTRISAALTLARDMLERDRVEDGSILLVSDLETAPEDLQALIRTLQSLRDRSITLRIVPLSTSGEARRTVESVAGPEAFAPAAAFDGDVRRVLGLEGSGGIPTGLLALGGLLLVVLALHERFAGRLALPRGDGSAS